MKYLVCLLPVLFISLMSFMDEDDKLVFETEFLYDFSPLDMMHFRSNVLCPDNGAKQNFCRHTVYKIHPKYNSSTEKYTIINRLMDAEKEGSMKCSDSDIPVFSRLQVSNDVTTRVVTEWSRFKIKQRWEYNYEQQRFMNAVVSITPVSDLVDNIYERESSLKVNQSIGVGKGIDSLYSNPSVSFLFNHKCYVDINSVNYLLGDKNDLKGILWNDVLEGEKQAYSAIDNVKLLTPKDISSIIFNKGRGKGSIDMETFKRITSEPLTFEEVSSFRLTQNWHFDEADGKLKSEVEFIQPYLELYDDNDNFQYAFSLFTVQ